MFHSNRRSGAGSDRQGAKPEAAAAVRPRQPPRLLAPRADRHRPLARSAVPAVAFEQEYDATPHRELVTQSYKPPLAPRHAAMPVETRRRNNSARLSL